jgi:hypothetical protein
MQSPHPPFIEAHRHHWKWSCSPESQLVSCYPAASRLRLFDLTLMFSVSLDEEFVRLETTCGDRMVDLGARNHNYLLLTLARRRLEDQAAGISPTSSGWVHIDELSHDPSLSGSRLNVDVFRIRQQFIKLGLADAEKIIERRPRTSELRIGTDRVAVVRL